jgi:hypothetical protein
LSKETLDFVPPLPPKNYKISSAFSYNFISALTLPAGPDLGVYAGLVLLVAGIPGVYDCVLHNASILAETMVNTALLHNRVGGVARLDLPVHCEVSPTYGAVPNIVITLPVAHEVAAIE